METDRLEQAIHRAVAATAAPDDARLAAILARLERTPVTRPAPRRAMWPWLLLAAAGVAAAGGGYLYVHRTAMSPQAVDTVRDSDSTEAPMPAPIGPLTSQPAGTETKNAGGQQRNTPIIYRQ